MCCQLYPFHPPPLGDQGAIYPPKALKKLFGKGEPYLVLLLHAIICILANIKQETCVKWKCMHPKQSIISYIHITNLLSHIFLKVKLFYN